MKWFLLILPFENISTIEEDDFLADGLTEELIVSLSNYDDINVASRTSSFFFKNKPFFLEDIRKKIAVTHVLEGSLRRQGEYLRVVVHLTDAKNGYTLWSQTYMLNHIGWLDLQQAIIPKITQKIIPASAARVPLHQVPNNDNDAYRFYLKGLYFFNRYSMDNIAKALEWFRKATQLQVDFAQAYAAMSTCELALGGFVEPSHLSAAKTYASKAIAINDQLMESHLSLTYVQIYYDWDWTAAEQSIQNALNINIKSALAHRVKGLLYRATGQKQNGIHAHEVATKYDPLNTIFINGLGWMFNAAGRFEEAIVEYQKCLDLDPAFRPAIEGIAWTKAHQGKWDEAISYFVQYQKMTGHLLKGWYGLGYVYGQMGDLEKAYEVLNKFDQRRKAIKGETLALDYATVYLGMGKLDEAFFYLNQAIDKYHMLTVGSLLSDPVYDPIREDERYFQLVERLHLTPFLNYRNNKKNSVLFNIQADTNEQLLIDAEQFYYAKSEGNYTRFYWKEGQQLSDRLLRITLHNAFKQINAPSILQSHRSFLVNCHHFQHLIKKGRNHFLVNASFKIEIPVSRGQLDLVRKLLP